MSNLVLRPIEVQVLRQSSSNDTRQVPATGATVSVAREGATVTQAVTSTASADATVAVGNVGRLALGDLVSPNASANLLQVRAVAIDGRSVTLRNVNGGGGASTTIALEGCALLHQGVGQTVEPACYAHVRKTSAVTFRDCTFEGTSPAPASGDTTGTSRPWVRVVGSDSVTFDACYFENDPHFAPNGTTPIDYEPQYFVRVETCPGDEAPGTAPPSSCAGVALDSARMVRGGLNQGLLRCLWCDDGSVAGVRVARLDAASSTRLEQFPGQGVLRDPMAVRIGANTHSSLVATGQAQDLEYGVVLPLAVADIPQLAHGQLPFSVKLPAATAAERAHFRTD